MTGDTLDMTAVTTETFRPFVGEVFRASDATGTIDLHLVDIEEGHEPIPGVRDRHSFTAVFLSETKPANQLSVMVTLENPGFGTLKGITITPNAGIPKPEWGTGHPWAAVFG